MRTAKEIDMEILKLREQLLKTKGTPTEIYTRIVGYYRSLRNWNKGKREEYNHRVLFSPAGEDTGQREGITPVSPRIQSDASLQPNAALRYIYFYRDSCPNCLPVRNLLEQIDMPGTRVNVDTEDGISAAMQHSIYATPTVVFFDAQSREVSRASDAKVLKELISSITQATKNLVTQPA